MPNLPKQLNQSTTTSNSSKYVFVLPLKPQSKPIDLPSLPSFPACLNLEYATLYLSRLGADPTDANVKEVIKRRPIEDCEVEGVWMKDGAPFDAIIVNADYKSSERVRKLIRRVSNDDNKNNDANVNKNLQTQSPRSEPLSKKTKAQAQPTPTPIPTHKLTFHQKAIIRKQMLLNLLKPLETSTFEVNLAQELFVKRFPFRSLHSLHSLSSTTSPSTSNTPKTNAKEIIEIKEFLMKDSIVHFVDLTLNYLYWTVIHPHALSHREISENLALAKIEKGNTNNNGIIADVTEHHESNSKNNIKFKDDITSFMGLTKISRLRLTPLDRNFHEKITSKLNSTFHKIKAEALRVYGRAGITVFLPVVLLAIRHAVDNVFVEHFSLLNYDIADVYNDKNRNNDCDNESDGRRIWKCIHDEITSVFDHAGYFSDFLSEFNHADKTKDKHKMKYKFNNTSNILKSVLTDPQSTEGRLMMNMNNDAKGNIKKKKNDGGVKNIDFVVNRKEFDLFKDESEVKVEKYRQQKSRIKLPQSPPVQLQPRTRANLLSTLRAELVGGETTILRSEHERTMKGRMERVSRDVERKYDGYDFGKLLWK